MYLYHFNEKENSTEPVSDGHKNQQNVKKVRKKLWLSQKISIFAAQCVMITLFMKAVTHKTGLYNINNIYLY
jgi:hypothetical protein